MYELPGFQLELSSFLKFPDEKAAASVDLSSAHRELSEKFNGKSVGFYDWPEDVSETDLKNLRKTAAKIRSDYEAVLLVGIGGSYLGAAALMDALSATSDDRKLLIHWISNVDRTSISLAEQTLKGKKTALVLISKSGSTVETLSVLYSFHSFFDKHSIYVVTDPNNGELRRLATQFGWSSLPVPENIGGRFSVLTAVGLFPLEISGVNTAAILEGSRAMRSFLETLKPKDNPAYLYALGAYLWSDKYHRNIHVLMPYESALSKIADWFVQLWAESIGKKRIKDDQSVGFTPIRCLGTTDQHSQLQLFKEGPQDKVIGFIDVVGKNEKAIPHGPYVSEAFSFLTKHSIEAINHEASLAVEKSLQRSGTPTYRFIFPALTAHTLGSFLFFQMTACAFAGELFGIRAFDQPGVEETKKLLRSAL